MVTDVNENLAMKTEPIVVDLRDCNLCGVPIATDPCRHALVGADRVVMSREAWDDLIEELNALRGLADWLDQ